MITEVLAVFLLYIHEQLRRIVSAVTKNDFVPRILILVEDHPTYV